MPIGLLLRSMGAPASVVELYELIEAQGLDNFGYQLVRQDDPIWSQIGAGEGTRHGIWIRGEGQTSKMTAALFFEGMDDDTISKLTSQLGPAALPAGA